MIVKDTILDQVEVTRTGNINIRLGLLLVEDGNEISCQWHRTVVVHGGDVDAQMAAVNDHLAQMSYPALAPADIAKIKKIIAAVA